MVALVGFGSYFDHFAGTMAVTAGDVAVLRAELSRESASPDVQRVAQWAVHHQDHGGLPFVVVDKAHARLFTFDGKGRLRGSTPVLPGAQRDHGAGVNATPAGRFVTDSWLSAAQGDGIVWVNAVASLSLHGLPLDRAPGPGNPDLASDGVQAKSTLDGSLHVAGEFYRDHLIPLRSQGSVAYVVPEFLPAQELFGPDDARDSRRDYAQVPRLTPARRPS